MADEPLDLINAVANGDAQREDVVKALKDQGIDALDLLVEVLAKAGQKPSSKAEPVNLLDPRRAASRPQVEPAHRVPQRPFVLNGTLYDPADIKRFDGQELHLIARAGGDPLLAIDDRDLMERWWQLSYISSMTKPMADEKMLTAEGGGSIGIESHGAGLGGGGGGGVGSSTDWSLEHPHTGASSSGRVATHAYFHEDIFYRGSDLELQRGFSFPDLTRVAWTFFGTGDWNDEISSAQVFATTVLWEHVQFGGSSLTLQAPNSDLVPYGWNDRTSSIEAF
jgi:hypothetical protein